MAGGEDVSRFEIVELAPPRALLDDYDRNAPPYMQGPAIPKAFRDLMKVRKEVFVDEQKVPLENEFDSDDARSLHWVIYVVEPAKNENEAMAPPLAAQHDTKEGNQGQKAAGTVRLVPYPHIPHADPSQNPVSHGHGAADGRPYWKLGRLAVRQKYRKKKLGAMLVEAALSSITQQLPAHAASPQLGESKPAEPDIEAIQRTSQPGFVLVHAQKAVQKVWERYGFIVDESMGEWQEEGIWHVGMWREIHQNSL